jgi:hypothetical protein
LALTRSYSKHFLLLLQLTVVPPHSEQSLELIVTLTFAHVSARLFTYYEYQ